MPATEIIGSYNSAGLNFLELYFKKIHPWAAKSYSPFNPLLLCPPTPTVNKTLAASSHQHHLNVTAFEITFDDESQNKLLVE